MGSIKSAANEDVWTLKAKLVHKQIFIKYRKKILKLTLVDEAGDTVELRSWSERKAYTLYRKVHEDQVYIVTNNTNYITKKERLHKPNTTHSTCSYETKHFWIELEEEPEMKRGFVKCRTNLKDIKLAIKDSIQNILGIFIDYKMGPPYPDPKLPYQGYFVTLMDDSGNYYRVLVWHSKYVEKQKFPLFHSERGDTILFTCVKLGWKQDNVKIFTLSSNRPIARQSECVNPRDKEKLIRHYLSSQGD